MKTILFCIVAVVLGWALLFGVSYDGHYYHLEYSRGRGVEYHNDPVR